MTRADQHASIPLDTAAGRTCSNASSPLTLWRTTSPDALPPEALEAVDATLSALRVPHGPGWAAARAGDTAAAVAVALRKLPGPGEASWLADAAMSQLLVLAAQGDPTAATVLTHGRNRLLRRREVIGIPGLAERCARRPRSDRACSAQA